MKLPLTLDDLCVLMAAGSIVLKRLPPRAEAPRQTLQAAIHHAEEVVKNYDDLLTHRMRCLQCREWFVAQRKGARFCSPYCSQLYRSLSYYHAQKKRKGQHGTKT